MRVERATSKREQEQEQEKGGLQDEKSIEKWYTSKTKEYLFVITTTKKRNLGETC